MNDQSVVGSILDTRKVLKRLLSEDLDFHDKESNYGSHNFHSFPAKFPPQVPAVFINSLTAPGDIVLDPMMGSGTTLVEAYCANRLGIGFDIDPLAIRIARVKTTPIDREKTKLLGERLCSRFESISKSDRNRAYKEIRDTWDAKTAAFVEFWFDSETRTYLATLTKEIARIKDQNMRTFFEVALSAIIITKSGGVSLALDLAHTRPHRAKVVFNREGDRIVNDRVKRERRRELLTKKLRSVTGEFIRKVRSNLENIPPATIGRHLPMIELADCTKMPLADDSVDLIVTSPPYAANAIDYMRAHKFSLVWLGSEISDLSRHRQNYIGGESVTGFHFESLPQGVELLLSNLSTVDQKRSSVLRRYYSEMTRVLRDMKRVLKPGKPAILVVGSNLLRGYDTKVAECLIEIGGGMGFSSPGVGVRNIDRDRRMLPARSSNGRKSQIEQRMHQEFVISLVKP